MWHLKILLLACTPLLVCTIAASDCPKGTLDILREAGLDLTPGDKTFHRVSQATKIDQAVLRQHRALLSSKNVCEDEDWRKKSLKLVREIPIAGVLGELYETTKFEASGIALRGDNEYFVACDNTRSLPRLNSRLQFKSNASWLVHDIEQLLAAGASRHNSDDQRNPEVSGMHDSQFEGITYLPDSDNFLVVKETIDHPDGYYPVIQELSLSQDGRSYRTILNCTVDFELAHANKGFEGIQHYQDKNGDRWLMGLCEGNYCAGGRHGEKKGHGRIVVSKFYQDENLGVCSWKPTKVVKIPKAAYFADYSDMAFRGNRLAIVSQEDSEVWIGEFDREKMEFTSEGAHYHFPRSDRCEQIYCNVEGVEWIDDDRLMLASDRAKANQPYICTVRDQSVHIMVLPHGHRKVDSSDAAAITKTAATLTEAGPSAEAWE